MKSASRLETAMISLALSRGLNFKARLQLRTRCTLICKYFANLTWNYPDVPGQENQVEKPLCSPWDLMWKFWLPGEKSFRKRNFRSNFLFINEGKIRPVLKHFRTIRNSSLESSSGIKRKSKPKNKHQHLVHGRRRPLFRLGEIEKLFPIPELKVSFYTGWPLT